MLVAARGLAIVLLLMVIGLAATTDVPAARAAPAIDQASAGAIDGGADARLAESLARAGAVGLLIVVLFFYRRDFFTRVDQKQAERDAFAALLEKSTAAITQSTVATARQTDATHRLARAVENIERRQAGLPPSVRTPAEEGRTDDGR